MLSRSVAVNVYEDCLVNAALMAEKDKGGSK